MATMRVQHAFNNKSGLAEDDVVNTLYFTGTGPITPVNAQVVVNHVHAFYDSSAIMAMLATSTMLTTRHTTKVYDMADPLPRTPILETTPTTPSPVNGTAQALPSEVAVCLSYRGAVQSGVNPARRRGRIYLGPINVNVSEQNQFGMARVAGTLRTNALAAAKAMQDAAATSGWTWSVWSPTTFAADPVGDFDPGSTPIVLVWMDDAFDTQRRRGKAPEVRTELLV